MLLPDQPGGMPHLAVAAGKDGNMYLMNEDSLGGHSSATNNVLGTYPIGRVLVRRILFSGSERRVSPCSFERRLRGLWCGSWQLLRAPRWA